MLSKRNDPPEQALRRIIWEVGLAAVNAAGASYVTYAAALAPVGTEAIVFRIWEAIW